MIQLEPPLRVASEADASEPAELGNFAGDDFPALFLPLQELENKALEGW